MKRKINNLHIHPFVIVKDIIKYFVASCYLTVMLMFFSDDNLLTFTKVTCAETTQFIFCLLIALEIVYQILTKSSVWLEKPETVVEKQPLGVARKITVPDAIKKHGRKVCAIHEAGHALIACLKDIEVNEVSLSGQTPHTSIVERTTNKQSVLNMVLMLYAGAAAEEVLIGDFCTGSMGDENSDFIRAKQYIKTYIVMTDGNVSKTFLDEELASEMIKLSKKLYSMAKRIIIENKEKLEIITDELLKKDSLSGQEIKKLMLRTH